MNNTYIISLSLRVNEKALKGISTFLYVDKSNFTVGRTLAFFCLEMTKLSFRVGNLNKVTQLVHGRSKSKPGSQDIQHGAISTAFHWSMSQTNFEIINSKFCVITHTISFYPPANHSSKKYLILDCNAVSQQ